VRILYLCRVFSGLETSLLSGSWRPTGAPTIYKVMERLATGPHDVRFVLTTKGVGREFRTAWTARGDRLLALAGFRRPMTVLAYLEMKGLAGRQLAVAVNGVVLRKEEFGSTTVSDGDRMEVVRPVGGG